MLAIGVVALLGLMAGGFLLHSRLDKLQIELAFAKREVESTNERLMSSTRGQSNQTRPIVGCSDDCALRQSVIGDDAADFAAEQCAADYSR
jgi:hypothetical protein